MIHLPITVSSSGFSRKLHKMVSEHLQKVDKNKKLCSKRREKFEAKNWKKLSEQQMKSLGQVQRSRYVVVSVVCRVGIGCT